MLSSVLAIILLSLVLWSGAYLTNRRHLLLSDYIAQSYNLFQIDMLPFFQKQLYLANAADFSTKHDYFYPLKHKILERYAHKDGWDRQVLEQECWTCGGTGWHSCDEECWQCDGSGIYKTKIYILQRYLLGSKLYHVPVQEAPSIKPINTIREKIKHDTSIPEHAGKRALTILMARYQPKFLVGLIILWLINNTLYKIICVLAHKHEYHYQPFIWCKSWYRFLLLPSALFAGYLPFAVNSQGIYLYRNEWHESIEHFNWILKAYKK